jgi:addiction module HigA family antidote
MKNPSHPGKSIRVACLEPNHLTITEGAKILGVTRQNLSNIVNEKSDLSPEMAIRVAKAFGGTPDAWYRMQSAYDIALAKKRSGKIKVKTYKPYIFIVGILFFLIYWTNCVARFWFCLCAGIFLKKSLVKVV